MILNPLAIATLGLALLPLQPLAIATDGFIVADAAPAVADVRGHVVLSDSAPFGVTLRDGCEG